MIVFPNCKINLGLHVLQKREDGYHDIETIFYPLALLDALEMVHSADHTRFTSSGEAIDVGATDNICMKAYRLLQRDHALPPVHIHLHKQIPQGAGLGGGSADGAFMLLLLNKKFNLGLTEQALLDYALQLGSDCPFFIRNSPMHATGRGEQMQPAPVDLSAYQFVVVNPRIHISTAAAFSKVQPSPHRRSLKEIVALPVTEWKTFLHNDFETPVFTMHPEIADIKQKLYKAGAIYASMSGSGSTVYGIFPKDEEVLPGLSAAYFVRHI